MRWILPLFVLLAPVSALAVTFSNKLDTEIKMIIEYKQTQNNVEFISICDNITTIYGYNDISYPLQTLCGYSKENPITFIQVQAVMQNGGAVVNCKNAEKLDDQSTVVISATKNSPGFACDVSE